MSDRLSEAFERALDEAGAKGHAPDDGGPAPTKRPRIGAGVPLGSAPPSGGEARFGLALDWTDEPLDRPEAAASFAARRRPALPPTRRRRSPPNSASARRSTPGELASRWRDFLWRHHPDRQPPEGRERANARVAIANTLYEQARRALAQKR